MANIKTDISLSKSLLAEAEAVARDERVAEQINQDGLDEEEREWLEYALHSYRQLLEAELSDLE